MKITFDTKNLDEVQEVREFLLTLNTEKAHSVTETAQKSTKAVKAKAEVTPKVETPSEVTQTKSTITLDILKDSAKNAVSRSSREEVKNLINKYAPKIVEVKEEDYQELFDSLEILGK